MSVPIKKNKDKIDSKRREKWEVCDKKNKKAPHSNE